MKYISVVCNRALSAFVKYPELIIVELEKRGFENFRFDRRNGVIQSDKISIVFVCKSTVLTGRGFDYYFLAESVDTEWFMLGFLKRLKPNNKEIKSIKEIVDFFSEEL